MSYCFEKGIPHSEYLGWDSEDRAKTIAFAIESSERCSLCGTAPWEWEQDKFAFTAVDEFCQGCYQKSIFSDTQGSSLPGTNVKLIPTTPQLNAQMALKAAKRRRMRME
jgi:hypothetical protein